MKLVTFRVSGPLGAQPRLGAHKIVAGEHAVDYVRTGMQGLLRAPREAVRA